MDSISKGLIGVSHTYCEVCGGHGQGNIIAAILAGQKQLDISCTVMLISVI